MMVAAHPTDLRAAKALGLATGYVYRPLEQGPDRAVERPPAAPLTTTRTAFSTWRRS